MSDISFLYTKHLVQQLGFVELLAIKKLCKNKINEWPSSLPLDQRINMALDDVIKFNTKKGGVSKVVTKQELDDDLDEYFKVGAVQESFLYKKLKKLVVGKMVKKLPIDVDLSECKLLNTLEQTTLIVNIADSLNELYVQGLTYPFVSMTEEIQSDELTYWLPYYIDLSNFNPAEYRYAKVYFVNAHPSVRGKKIGYLTFMDGIKSVFHKMKQ